MKCADCKQEIMQRDPEICPYCHSRNLISEEQIAEIEKTTPAKKKEAGKLEAVIMKCPYCGASQKLASKSNEVICSDCNKTYIIPEKILDLL